MDDKRFNIAIIGTGAAGLTAGYILQREHLVTFFEKNAYVGGHSNTVVIPNGPDKGTPVDTGFMVLNDRTYPTFRRLLQQLRVPVRNSDATFGYWDEKSGLQYAGTGLNGLFAQRANLWSPAFWLMLRERGWFKARARKDLARGKLEPLTLGEYLREGNYSKLFIDDYLVPLGSSHWSTSVREMMDFPMETFARYFEKLGLLGFAGKPQWQTVVEGSQSYVQSILKTLKTKVRTGEAVEEVKRNAGGVVLRTREGKEESFDKVVMACHADEALALLAEPTEDERRLLSSWSYQKNFTVLHTDRDVMPPLERAWASWNYTRERETTQAQPASVTYHVNRLQGLQTREQYFVTLNRVRPIPERHVVKEIYYTHPTFTRAAVESQKELPKLNGENHTYYCGSYFGYGFHEDAVKSALDVAWHFGMDF
jgi:predicted NAD/FAD-binding protein